MWVCAMQPGPRAPCCKTILAPHTRCVMDTRLEHQYTATRAHDIRVARACARRYYTIVFSRIPVLVLVSFSFSFSTSPRLVSTLPLLSLFSLRNLELCGPASENQAQPPPSEGESCFDSTAEQG